MVDEAKIREYYASLNSITADLDVMTQAAEEEDEKKELEGLHRLAVRLTNKVRAYIAENLFRALVQ